MRKLASVKVIKDKKPIEGADFIEAVQVDGWWCVSKKDEFSVGDKCIYCEVDSVLPIREEYEFLRKSCYVNKDWIEGFRLRTIKLKKQISQGLVMPVGEHTEKEVGSDLTEELGVKKWDPPVPACLAGEVKGNFPSFLRKTDQERIQNFYDELVEKYRDHDFEATMKLDGSSCTIYSNNGEYGVCSRNLELKMSEANKENSFVKMSLIYEGPITSIGRNIAIQSELLGPGVQGNREGLKEAELFVFDMFDIDKQEYLTSVERHKLCEQIGMKHVPVLNNAINILHYSLDEILERSDIPSMNHKFAEGIVYKSLQDPSISFKAINNRFLLKEN